MRINRRTDYAIRVMLALAEHPYGERLSTKSIREEMLVPRAFLERIIAELSRAKLIVTFPGPNGGIQLSEKPETINLLQIWEAIEGALMISDCLQSPEECPLHEDCPVHGCWGKLQKVIQRELEAITISQLSIEMKRKKTGHSDHEQ